MVLGAGLPNRLEAAVQGGRRSIELEASLARLWWHDGSGQPQLERQVDLAQLLGLLRQYSETPLLPMGTRWVVNRGDLTVFVVEQPPRKRLIRWERFVLAVTLALPYVVFMVAVHRGRGGVRRVVDLRTFFRNSPLITPDDHLYQCNLPNTYADGHYCWTEITEVAGENYSLPALVEGAIELYWQSYFRDFISFTDSFWINTFWGWWLVSKIRPSWVLKAKWRLPEEGYRTMRQATSTVIRGLRGGNDDPAADTGDSFDQLADFIYRLREMG